MAGNVDAKDLGALERAVNDTAARAGGLWISFITLSAYLTITIGSVTHRNLLLETPLKLPVLNIELPLAGFFVVAPVIFILFHFYLFLQLQGLSQKIASYDEILREQVPEPADRRLLRQRLDSFIFVQLLAGPRERREGRASVLLKLVEWITIVGIPITVLLSIEFTFLPYHAEAVTWTHRCLILLDLLMIWGMWGTIQGVPFFRMLRLQDYLGAGFSVVVVVLAMFVAVFPGETNYTYVRFWPTKFLFEGEIDSVSSRSNSFFANRLVVIDQVVIDVDKLAKLDVSISLRGRDLRHAVLDGSDLRKADFTGAALGSASLARAKLSKAKFCSPFLSAFADCADLRGVNLSRADLEETDLSQLQLTAAHFQGAHLANANLSQADVRGASFLTANVKGAVFVLSRVATANLVDVKDAELGDVIGKALKTPEDYRDESALADALLDIACEAEGNPHVARGLIANTNLTLAGQYFGKVADKIRRAGSDCPGAKGLISDDLAALDELSKRFKP